MTSSTPGITVRSSHGVSFVLVDFGKSLEDLTHRLERYVPPGYVLEGASRSLGDKIALSFVAVPQKSAAADQPEPDTWPEDPLRE
jgi:hypothetical protein